MTATGTQDYPGIRRCAVCKIDRKGRFILADTGAQNIFGLNEVELFGRPLTDFLDPDDHAAVEAITNHRNPYETVFDATPVTLIGANGRRIPATLIISVNFGGGNPANYQIIIHPEEPGMAGANRIIDRVWLEYLEYLSSCDEVEASDPLAQKLHDLVPMAAVSLYENDTSETNLLARVPAAGECTDAESDGASDDRDINDADVHEVRATFSLTESRLGLAVFRLNRTVSDFSLGQRQAELAALVLYSLCPPPPTTDANLHEPGPAVSSGRLLGQLGIGVLELDASARILERNPAFDAWFDPGSDLVTLSDLIEFIHDRGDRAAAAKIRAYFEVSSACVASPSLQLDLLLSSAGRLSLTFERLHPGTDDLSGCFLVTRRNCDRLPGRRPIQVPVDLPLAAARQLNASLTAAQDVWQKLVFGQRHEPERESDFHIECLSHHLNRIEHSLTDLEGILDALHTTEPDHEVDLGRVIDQITADLQQHSDECSLVVKHSGLPKVRSQRKKLTAALRYIFESAICRNERSHMQVQVSATATATDGTWTVSIQDDGPNLSKKQVRKAFDYIAIRPTTANAKKFCDPAALAKARALIQSLGGRVEMRPAPERGTNITVSIPGL